MPANVQWCCQLMGGGGERQAQNGSAVFERQAVGCRGCSKIWIHQIQIHTGCDSIVIADVQPRIFTLHIGQLLPSTDLELS